MRHVKYVLIGASVIAAVVGLGALADKYPWLTLAIMVLGLSWGIGRFVWEGVF